MILVLILICFQGEPGYGQYSKGAKGGRGLPGPEVRHSIPLPLSFSIWLCTNIWHLVNQFIVPDIPQFSHIPLFFHSFPLHQRVTSTSMNSTKKRMSSRGQWCNIKLNAICHLRWEKRLSLVIHIIVITSSKLFLLRQQQPTTNIIMFHSFIISPLKLSV